MTQNGAVIKDCSGTQLLIDANDVTVEDVMLTPNYWQMGLWLQSPYHGLVVKDVTVYFAVDEGNHCIALDGPATLERVNLQGYCQNAIYVTASGTTIADSYINIEDSQPTPNGTIVFAPCVGIKVWPTTVSASQVVSDVIIKHDTVITQTTTDTVDPSGPISVGGYGTVSNVTVEDSMIQGGYTIVDISGPGTNRKVINNEFSKHSLQKIWDLSGQYTISGNVWANTNTPVPGP